MEERFTCKNNVNNNNKLFDNKEDLNIIRINLKEIFNESKKNINKIKKKDINNSFTESDSDIETQNINLNKNNSNKKKKDKLSKIEKKLLIKGIYKYKNNLKKIKKYIINKPVSYLRIGVQKFYKRIRRLIKNSKDENVIKSKVELLLKKELKENYEPSNLPNFILFLMENILLINKNNKNKKINELEKINKNEIFNELTTATTKKSNEILNKINNNTVIKSDDLNSLINKTLLINENDNDLSSINITNENNIIDNNNNKDNTDNYNLFSYSININNPLKKEQLFNEDLTIQNDIFKFDDPINQSLFYSENDNFNNQILKLNDSNFLIDEYFKIKK